MDESGEPGLLEVNGSELYVERSGPAGAPALAFVHGGPGYHSYTFSDLIGEELSTDHQLVCFDQRGCGRSAPLHSAALGIGDLVADLEQLRRSLGIPRWTLIGHGVGVVIALEAARQFPSAVRAVLSVSPWVDFPRLAGQLLRSAAALRGTAASDPAHDPAHRGRGGLARLEAAFGLVGPAELLGRMQFRDVRSRMHLEFSEAASQLAWSTEVFWAMARGGLWELDYLPRAAGCPVPQLVVAGSEDATSYPEQAQELASACSVPLEVVEAGHFPWVEEPEAFLEALAELERSAGEAAD